MPPAAVQREIVESLDSFLYLQAELKAELEYRSRQYAYYRQTLLTFGDSVPRATLGDVVHFRNGKPHERLVDPEGGVALMTPRFIATRGEAARFVNAEDVLTPASCHEIALVMSDLPKGRALARAFYVDADGRYAVNQRVCLLAVRDLEA